MNTKTLIAAALVSTATLLGSSAVFAQEAVPATWANEGTTTAAATPSGAKTRAEVKAELLAARARGELSQPGDVYGQVNQALLMSQKAHAQQVLASQKTHLGEKAGG